MTVFRRRVDIMAQVRGGFAEVRAALEDDFHHFRVWLRHEDGHLSAIGGEALRYPYSLCPQACQPLQHLLGMPLDRVAHSVTRQTDASQQCTHLLDLAGLALAAAARGTHQRRYEIEVGRRIANRTHASLAVDDHQALAWDVDGTTLMGPAPYVGLDLRAGMARWAIAHLDEDTAEAALLLRRCTLISMGRGYDLDAQVHASSTGRCYSQQPARCEQALRMKGSTLDFSHAPSELCAQDQAWLRQDVRETLPG
jgi:hypothetical protein